MRERGQRATIVNLGDDVLPIRGRRQRKTQHIGRVKREGKGDEKREHGGDFRRTRELDEGSRGQRCFQGKKYIKEYRTDKDETSSLLAI